MENNMNDNFAVFILTHGRPENVITYKTLERAGYTGKIYIIIDNEDETSKKYYDIFGDKVIMFDKIEISRTFDEADNFNDRRSIVYARNACFEIAKNLDIEYFLQLDDDYTNFNFRMDASFGYVHKTIANINPILEAFLDFYKNTTIKSVAMAQGGDFIGGEHNGIQKSSNRKRKCMNSFFCSTKRPFKFVGRINEDVNTYTHKASTGHIFITCPSVALEQKQTQSNKGGMTDIYLENGTYNKSFYTIIFQPSSVKINLMGIINRRLHHRINWTNTVPNIIEEKYKK